MYSVIYCDSSVVSIGIDGSCFECLGSSIESAGSSSSSGL